MDLRIHHCLPDGGDVMSHPATEHGASHGSVKSYMIGFILSIILTDIPFWMVMDGGASKATILAVVLVCAVVQCWCIWFTSCTWTVSLKGLEPDCYRVCSTYHPDCCCWLVVDHVEPQLQHDEPLTELL